MFLKRALIAGSFVVATAFAATAADIPLAAPAPPPAPPAAPAFSWAGGYFGADIGVFFSALAPVRAANVGLHGGYNFQFGNIVAGVRLDANGIKVIPGGPGPFGPFNALNTDLYGRVGFAVGDSLLVYGAAGVGYCFGPACFTTGHFIAAAGVEFALNNDISLYAEVGRFWAPGGLPLGTRVQVGVNMH